MIYFLVNNTYQLYDARLHLSDLQSSGFEVILLEVPHLLVEPDRAGFMATYSFERFQLKSYIKSWRNASSLRRKLDNEIVPCDDDVLFIYTEFEPFNQIIAVQFKNSGARVYLIEDGGFATYVPFSSNKAESLSAKEKIKELMIRAIPSLSVLHFHKVNGIIFPWMDDSILDGVCIYRKVKIARSIRSLLIQRPIVEKINVIDNSVIFLNDTIYYYYQTEDKYLLGLNSIIKSLCEGFSIVYFKFHPRESLEWRKKITDVVLDRYQRIIIINHDVGVESIVELYRPSVAASYFSAALLSLQERGVEPMYLFHLFDELRRQPVFMVVASILNGWGYRFLSDLSDIDAGYKSGIITTEFNQSKISLIELITNK